MFMMKIQQIVYLHYTGPLPHIACDKQKQLCPDVTGFSMLHQEHCIIRKPAATKGKQFDLHGAQ